MMMGYEEFMQISEKGDRKRSIDYDPVLQDLASSTSVNLLERYGALNRLMRSMPEDEEIYRTRREPIQLELLRRLREYDHMIEDTS